MDAKEKSVLAEALGVSPEIVHYLPELLADIWVLGSWPKVIVDWLRHLDLPPQSTQVLDLGCGKGAVAIHLAQESGFRVLGIDLFPPFIQEAKFRASKYGLTSLCKFEIGDIRNAIAVRKSLG